MQQPPSGEDSYEKHKLPPAFVYRQRALEPLQRPYTQPIREHPPVMIPPVRSPKKKSPKRRTTSIGVVLGIVALLGLCMLVLPSIITQSLQQQAVINDDSEPAVVATMPPEQTAISNLIAPTPSVRPLEWVTTHIFEGDGNQRTETFQISDTWKIVWSCGAGTTTENIAINVYASDDIMLDPVAVNTMCDIGNNNGETIEHQGGSVYLNVLSEGGWSLRIQEQQ